MKILHVCANYHPSKGGPQYTMKHLSEKLVGYYGDNVEVVTTNAFYGPTSKIFKRIKVTDEIVNGVEIHRKKFRRWHFPFIKLVTKIRHNLLNKSLPFSLLKLKWGIDSPGIIKAMNRSSADVIMVTTGGYNFCDYPLWRFKTANPKPFVLYGSIHFRPEHDIDKHLIEQAKLADAYIANTGFEKKKLIELGVDDSKIVVTGTGVTISDFICRSEEVHQFKKNNRFGEQDIVIGYIGRLKKGKGLDILTDALVQLMQTHSSIKIIIAGESTDYVPELKNIITNNNLPVILIEDFENDKKAVLYNAMDIFVMPSASESFGVVFLEAWAAHKPVIGANIGAVSFLIEHGKDGLLYEPANRESLFNQLHKLVTDKCMRDQLGKNGYEKAKNKYSWHKVVAGYRNAYLLGIENFNAKRESIAE